MAIDVTKMLRKVLADLEADRDRVDQQIAAVRRAMTPTDGGTARRPAVRSRKPMSAAARQAVSRRMKAYWAKRRRGKQAAAKRA